MKKTLCLLFALLLVVGLNASALARELPKLLLSVEDGSLTLTLEDNSAARSLLSQLPLTLTFEDYNGTEKIAYPPEGLDLSDAPESCDPDVGTLAYYAPWGNLCIFYQDFRYSEGLVPLGKLEGDMELLTAMGDGFTVTLTPEAEMTPEVAAQSQDSGERVLIAYFSLGQNADDAGDVDATTSASLLWNENQMVGTTEYVAQLIQNDTGGQMHCIETVHPYPTEFNAVVDQNHEEAAAGFLPELVASDLDMAQYDTVFLGYPVWAGNAPQAVYAFLSQYDLSGKTVIPFCTHDGYGAGGSYAGIASAIEGETAVLDGLAIEATDVPESEDAVLAWLREIGVQAASNDSTETKITITIGDTVLNGLLYDTALAQEISRYFPLTISAAGFGGREYYGVVEFYPENWEGGQTVFENGEITYCEAHHNMAIFYAQTDDPILSVEVATIGKVTSDLTVFDNLPEHVDITFAMAE